MAWLIPLAWCAVSGATLCTMDAPEALLLPALAVIALVVAIRTRATRPAA